MANISLFDIATSEQPSNVDYSRPSTAGESISASFALAYKNNSFSKIKDYLSRESELNDDDSPVMQPDELNSQYPYMGTPFAEPMSARRAELLAKKAREDRQLQNIVDGNRGNFFTESAEVAAGLAGNIIDPVGIAAGVSVEAGLTKALAKTAIGSRLGYKSLARAQQVRKSMKTAKKANLTEEVSKHALELKYLDKATNVANNIGRNVGEGVVGNLLEEAAINAPLSSQELQDYQAYESVAFAIGAGIAFPAVMGATAKSFSYLKRNPKLNEDAMALAEQQASQGKAVDISYIENKAKMEALPELETELRDAELAQDIDRVNELEAEIQEIKAIKQIDEGEAVKKANSVEENYDFDPSLDRSNEIDPQEKVMDSGEFFETDLAPKIEENVRAYGIENSEEINAFAKAEVEKASTFREATDTLIECFNGRAS